MKDYARSFYKSKAWKETQAAYMSSKHYICERCGGMAKIVHHKTYITPENINDPSIALNPKNLESLCHDCHTKETKGCDGDVVQGYYFDENGLVVRQQPPGGQK